jgi:uncharacterized protein
MAQPAKAQEPSMEEILASIRRIIADDDATKPPAKPAPQAAEAAPARAPKDQEPLPARAVPKGPEPTVAKAAPPPAAIEPPAQDDIDALLAGVDELPAESAAAAPEEVFDLTEAMTAPEPPPAAGFRRIDPGQDVVFEEPPAPPASPMPPASRAEPPSPAAPRSLPVEPLLSSAASAAVHSAFGTLAHSMLVQNSCTLEDLVKEMLRPMLKTWLDDNLPVMVERLVRAEIERVARGPRG